MLEIVNVRIYGRRPAVIRRMAWRSPEKPRRVFCHGGGTPNKTDCGFELEDHKPGLQLQFSDSDSDEEDKALEGAGGAKKQPKRLGRRQIPSWVPIDAGIDAGIDAAVGQKRKEAPGATAHEKDTKKTSVGRPVPLITSDGEVGEEWVCPRKRVDFSEGDGGAASAGGASGAAHETVDEHQGKEDDAYDGFFADEGHDAAAQESHTGDYTSYPPSHLEEEWRKKLEEEEATTTEAGGGSENNGAAAEAGAAEDISDFPQTLEYVAPEHAAEADARDAAGRAESPVMKGHCDYCQEEVWSYEERGRMRRRGQDVLVHKTCKEEAKKKALQVEVVQVVRKCYVCQQDIAAKDHVQTQHGSRHKSC